MAIAGKVAITPGGEWSVDVAYDKLVVVTFGNNVYLSIKPSTGIEPTNEEYWMLLIENVTQEQYESILNGTTAVGNALKLNGLTAEEFLYAGALGSQAKYYSATVGKDCNDIEEFLVLANGTTATHYPSSGYFYILTLKFSDTSKKQIALEYTGDKMYTRRCISGTWEAWVNSADGGNADTVDGYYASDFQKTDDKRELTALKTNVTTPTDIRTLMWQFPSGHYTWVNTWNANVTLPFTGILQIDWERKFQEDNSGYYGTLTIRTMTNNSQWATCSIYNNTQYTEWQSFLPLTGGTLKDSLSLNDGWANIGGEPNSAYLIASNTPGDLDNTRMLIMFNKNYLGDTSNALQIWEKINGLMSVQHTVLHTGNSQKVVSGGVAPTDTSGTTIWIDTENKVIKKYVDGAWTIVA